MGKCKGKYPLGVSDLSRYPLRTAVRHRHVRLSFMNSCPLWTRIIRCMQLSPMGICPF